MVSKSRQVPKPWNKQKVLPHISFKKQRTIMFKIPFSFFYSNGWATLEKVALLSLKPLAAHEIQPFSDIQAQKVMKNTQDNKISTRAYERGGLTKKGNLQGAAQY